MMNRQRPPGRTSFSCVVVVKPLGPHHTLICFGSVHAFQTISRGASNMRVMTISRSDTASLFLFAATGFSFPFLCLNFAQVRVQAIEALFPEFPVALDPAGNILERRRFEPAGTPLRLAAASDEAGGFQHLEMLRYRRKAHLERLRQVVHGFFPRSEPGENCAPGMIGKGGESAAEAIGGHALNWRSM